MKNDLISRMALLEAMPKNDELSSLTVRRVICDAPAVDVEPVITGETSDGYHTFNELYDHRAKLFSVIVRNYPSLCWKARKHHDGTMYDGMFIVGINTPAGQASYHYDIEPYWEMFDCEVLECAPEWDGHTPQQAIDRIASMGRVGEEGFTLLDLYKGMLNKIVKLERERDAAVEDMSLYAMCEACKRGTDRIDAKCPFIDDCQYGTKGHFEWRGVKEE